MRDIPDFTSLSHYNMYHQTEILGVLACNLQYGRILQYNMGKKMVDGKGLQFGGGLQYGGVAFGGGTTVVFIEISTSTLNNPNELTTQDVQRIHHDLQAISF